MNLRGATAIASTAGENRAGNGDNLALADPVDTTALESKMPEHKRRPAARAPSARKELRQKLFVALAAPRLMHRTSFDCSVQTAVCIAESK